MRQTAITLASFGFLPKIRMKGPPRWHDTAALTAALKAGVMPIPGHPPALFLQPRAA